MSSISLNAINSCTSATATYLQNNPNTNAPMSSTLPITGGTFASNPWISPASAGLKVSNLAATINASGAIVVMAACKISISWCSVFATTSTNALQTQFFILPTVSSTTLNASQISGKANPLTCNVFNIPAGGSVSGLGVNGSYLAKSGDIFVLGSSDPNMNMRLGILQITTEPLIG